MGFSDKNGPISGILGHNLAILVRNVGLVGCIEMRDPIHYESARLDKK